MFRSRLLSALMVVAGLCLAAVPASPNCTANTIGSGNHKVCAVLGNPCESKTGSCITIIIPKENTQGGDCICMQNADPFPNDSTFLLNPTGPLPAATGHASVRWLPGRRAVAIGLRGLTPAVSYQVIARVGAVGNCSGGSPVAIGAPVVADGLGDAVVIEQVPALCPISVREAGGAQRTVLCGAPPLSAPSAPTARPWSMGALGLGLAAAAVLALRRRWVGAGT